MLFASIMKMTDYFNTKINHFYVGLMMMVQCIFRLRSSRMQNCFCCNHVKSFGKWRSYSRNDNLEWIRWQDLFFRQRGRCTFIFPSTKFSPHFCTWHYIQTNFGFVIILLFLFKIYLLVRITLSLLKYSHYGGLWLYTLISNELST